MPGPAISLAREPRASGRIRARRVRIAHWRLDALSSPNDGPQAFSPRPINPGAMDWPELFFFRPGGRRRTFSHDQQNGILILGAIPMHLFAEMRDEAAGGHRGGVGRIEF